MKRQIALGLALVMMAASTGVEAQLGGLLRKKAGEVLGGKKPAPPPTADPAPAPETDAPATPAPATPSGSGDRGAAPAAAKDPVSPLEVSELPVRPSADQVLRGGVRARSNGDWEQLPYIQPAAVAAAYALDESAQVALVETVGAALKALVMSATFVAEHDTYIQSEHKAVNHGLTGVVSIEEAVKKNDLKALEAIQSRQMVAMAVDQVQAMPASYLKEEFTRELADWAKRAGDPKRRDRAKYQKLVAKAQPLQVLAPDDEKFRRGYAVLKSIDNDGPDTEEAVFAIHARQKQEAEQLAYDQHNLKGQLKQQLSAFVAIASKVDFAAQTVEKNKQTLFVNPAYERQGALWKACFRAGQAPTAAAVKLAKAWLAEL
jgi:hypothetical protein